MSGIAALLYDPEFAPLAGDTWHHVELGDFQPPKNRSGWLPLILRYPREQRTSNVFWMAVLHFPGAKPRAAEVEQELRAFGFFNEADALLRAASFYTLT